jgi:DNA-binding MarR family transcriptional regulator
MGNLMSRSLDRFDARVLTLMSRNEAVPLSLSNLAARGQLTAAHVQITRHLPVEGTRLTDLAARAGVTKQAMGKLVDQCEAWGLVRRTSDRLDARARTVRFTPIGQAWLGAFQMAVAQAEDEMRQAIGVEVATVIALGLEAYVG